MSYFLRSFFIFLFFISTILFNVGLIDIRFDEVNYLLGKAASDEEASNAIGIIAKYELIKRRMEFGEENIENYELEARIQALISGDQFTNTTASELANKAYLIPIKYLLYGIRFALGKEIVNPKEESKIIRVLEIGYFWERNRKYIEAIKTYDDVLNMPELGASLRSVVLIHKAFCLSMMSEYEKAKHVYETIINNYPNSEAGILSWKLLAFLLSMEDKLSKVNATTMTLLEKAKQYYWLMDYRNSIKYLSLFIQKNNIDTNIAEARYFKGRSHEELGEVEEAVNEYRTTIKIDKSKRWAREASRRMLMLSEFYNYQKKMADEVKKQLIAYKDDSFLNSVKKFKGMVSESSIKDELMKKMGEQVGSNLKADDNILELINSIGELDLTGEKDALEQQKKENEIKEMRQKLISSGAQSQQQIRELERRNALADNPFRRPAFLKKNIDDNINQLRYIYNRKLRTGIALSGKMVVEIQIQSNGLIADAGIINSNIGDTQFEKEVIEKIKTWNFKPVPDSLGIMKIRYPFEFYEEF